MSSDITKRALSAGLGVGALALLAPRASADTPFTSFTFPATGAPTARTMSDRLAETKNVKDFGAGGNGSTDDTAAIQAAVNTRAVIFFPPGKYEVSRPISFASGPEFNGIRVFGHRAWISGNFPGYIFDRPPIDVENGELIGFEGLSITNGHHQGGCIRMGGSVGGWVHKCSLVGIRPLTLTGILSVSVRDCRFSSIQDSILNQSIAIFSHCNQLTIDNCDIAGFYHGVRSQSGTLLQGCRIEMNHVGFVNGMTEDGGDYSSGCMIEGTSFEANDTAIWLQSGNLSSIRSVSIQGQNYSPQADQRPGGGNAHYGLKFDGGEGTVIQSLSASGYHDAAAIYIGPNVHHCAFICCDAQSGGMGVPWSIQANRSALDFTLCRGGGL
jgi:hypothetical protein